MKRLITWLIISCFTFPVFSQQTTLPAVYLYNFTSAQSSAMGYVVAVGRPYWGLFQNPALVGLRQQRAFSALFANLRLQQKLYIGGLYFPHIKESAFSLAAGWGVLQVGDIDGRDAMGNPTERFAIYHNVGVINVAYGGFIPEEEWYSPFTIGISVKGLWNNYYYIKGMGWGADVGLLWGMLRDDFEWFPYTLQIGIVASELGGKINWNTGTQEVINPRFRLAILWSPREWIQVMSETTRWPSGEILLGAGMEINLLQHVALRAGWHSLHGITFGLGFQWGEEKRVHLSAAQLMDHFTVSRPWVWEVDAAY